MRQTLILFVSLLFPFILIAQTKNDPVKDITITINNYFDGYVERDIVKLNKAFDIEHGTMKVPVDENNHSKGYKNRYFKEVVPKWGNRKKLSSEALKDCSLEILNIDIVEKNIASAKMKMTIGDVSYIDILSLHCIGNTWKITNKIYYTIKSK